MKVCKNCKTKFVPAYNSLQQACSVKCAIELSKKKSQKEWRIEKKVLKEKLKTHSDYEKDLQVEINSIVRLIDRGVGCIATGARTGKANAGHYISVGANNTIRFNLLNIYLQSEHSNTYKAADTHRYREGIIRMYGKDLLEEMDALNQLKTIKLTIPELKEKTVIARSIVKHLKLEDKEYLPEERIELRRKFNNMIGIYK